MRARILIVDDSLTIRRSLRSLVELHAEWEVCGEAENGKVAVEMAQRLLPDVIILDLSMPVMNGLDAARQIRAASPDVQILLFTMHSYPQLLEEARKLGVNKVLSKMEPSKLPNVVRSLLAA